MHVHELFEAMSPTEAIRLFKSLGIDDAATLDAAGLQAVKRRLARQHHPDVGGNTATMALINAAYDALTKENGNARQHYTGDEPAAQRWPDAEATPTWAWAGYSGGIPPRASISRQDYRDVNYIKKRMWELSGHSTQQWHIQGFDGDFLRGFVTVFGSPKIFRDMAEAMVTWQTEGANSYDCRAVLVSRRGSKDKTVLLIWADGVYYGNDPIPIEHDSFNANAGNDPSFDRRLRQMIDYLRENGRPHEQPDIAMVGGRDGRTPPAGLDVGDFVVHRKYGLGRVINPATRGYVRVAFADGTTNVRAASLRPATTQERRGR